MQQTFIITTQDQLAEVFQAELERFWRSKSRTQEEPVPERMSVEEATAFLNKNGFKISLATVRRFVMEEKIPYSRFGRRVYFIKKQLLEWAEDRAQGSGLNSTIQALSASAKRQQRNVKN